MRLAAAVFAVLAVLPVTAAQATTVELKPDYDPATPAYIREWSLTVTADPGEQNDIDVAVDAGSYTFTVSDHGAPIEAGDGCEESASDPETVTCVGGVNVRTGGFTSRARVDAGDENDMVRTRGASSYTVLDGEGDDDIDAIETGTVLAGPGRDQYVAYRVSYADRTAGVNVSLDGDDNDGEPGEFDNVVALHVIGSPKNDAIAGNNFPNEIDGHGGVDTLSGDTADDTLTAVGGSASGGPGADRITVTTVQGAVTGGDGDDTITVRGDGTGAVSGDAGIDVLDVADRSLSLEFTPSVALSLDGLQNDGTGALNIGGFEWYSTRRAWFVGTAGNDDVRIETGIADGGAGDDRLTGGAAFTGGRGRDVILHRPTSGQPPGAVFARDGEQDQIDCGTSQPAPLDLDPIDVVIGCVPLVNLATTAPRFRADSKGRISVPLRCLKPSTVPCSGEVRVTAGKLELARGTTGPIAAGAIKKVRLKLSSRTRAALKRGRTVTGSLAVETRAFTDQTRTNALGKTTIKPPSRRK